MLRPIVKLGGAALATPAAPVESVTDEIRRLIDDLTDTMYAAPGIGLAAPQVGVGLRVCVIDLSVGKQRGDLVALVNPEFVSRDGLQLEEEGCLSVPGFTATVARPARVTVRYLDRDGMPRTIDGAGLMARALQHELDHLEGRLFLDRLRALKRAMIVRKVRALQRRGRW